MEQTMTAPPTIEVGAPLDAATVAEAFQRTVARYGPKVALRTLDGQVSMTWTELGARVSSVAAGLASMGVSRGDTLALMLPNTVECHMIDYAALHLGAVPFTIYNSSPAEGIAHQLRNAGTRVVVTQQSFLATIREAVELLENQVRQIVLVDGAGGSTTLEAIEAAGDSGFNFEEHWRALTTDDLVTLIYTSGTTGPPKGVEWSHRTVMAQQRAMHAALPLPTDDVISFLPMAHAGGRSTVHYLALGFGATITVCPDMSAVPQAVREVHPDAFFSTPRLWEKLQVAIESMIEALPDEAARSANRAAVEVGLRTVQAQDAAGKGSHVTVELVEQHAAALELLRPMLAALGLDKLKAAFVGGAPCTPEIVQFFRAVGVPLLEAYGLTEGSLNIFNRVFDFKTGSAGKALPGVEIRLAEDGELLCRSDLNMVGYRGEPRLSADTLDADGWLHTGDIAQIDDAGYVTIVDRKKEIMISSAGKNMSPANIEAAIKGETSLIGQIVSIGDGRRYVTALVTLDPEAAKVHASRLKLDSTDLTVLALSPELRAEVEAAIERGNERLSSPERIRKFVVLPMAWLPDSDELTPTAKLKRRPIAAKYAREIENLYAT